MVVILDGVKITQHSISVTNIPWQLFIESDCMNYTMSCVDLLMQLKHTKCVYQFIAHNYSSMIIQLLLIIL